MTQKLKLSITTITALTLIGCGGGGSTNASENTNANETNNTALQDNTNNTTTETTSQTSINKIEGDIENRLAYIIAARDMVKGTEKKACHKMSNGNSHTIQWAAHQTEMNVYYKEYSNENCVGSYPDVRLDLATYKINIGNVINDGKAIEIDLQFVEGDDLTNDVPNDMLGNDIASIFYTTVVSQGKYENLNLAWGVAKPSEENDGSTANKRANDFSDYTSGAYYFAQ